MTATISIGVTAGENLAELLSEILDDNDFHVSDFPEIAAGNRLSELTQRSNELPLELKDIVFFAGIQSGDISNKRSFMFTTLSIASRIYSHRYKRLMNPKTSLPIFSKRIDHSGEKLRTSNSG